jgi:hypothetical protein
MDDKGSFLPKDGKTIRGSSEKPMVDNGIL